MYQVPLPTTGRLFVMPHPSPRRLEHELEAIRNAGVNLVISLLDNDDVRQLGLEREGEICIRLGVDFIHHPIVDYGLPEPVRFEELTNDIAARLNAGQSAAIHCRAGIGRTGLLACCLLKRLGFSTEDAIHRVSEARTTQVPETSEQRRFIAAYSSGIPAPLPSSQDRKVSRSPSQD